MILSQKNLCCQITTTAGDSAFVVRKFSGEEGLSVPFCYEAELLSTQGTLAINGLVGTVATVTVTPKTQDDALGKASRHFSGIITRISQGQTQTADQGAMLCVYHMEIRPSFWLLSLSRDHRIFQNQSALDIINTLCSENGVNDIQIQASSAGKKQRIYCVQYGESHLDFIHRLMEEEGLFYYFSHDDGKHTLVIIDANKDFKALPDASVPMTLSYTSPAPYINEVQSLSLQCRAVAKGAKVNDFDYQKPSTALKAASSGEGKGGDVYYYPGLYNMPSDGEALADSRLQALEWQRQTVDGKSTVLSLCAGYALEVTKHPRADMNQKYVLCGASISIEQMPDSGAFFYSNTFRAFPFNTPYKPLLQTYKPRIFSTQTAIVAGPSGEEVYADAMGRIKVQFPWDIRGKKNEDSSCWIRVAQSWSGNNWGALVVPRIGMEVVVTYVDGDPDRPLAVGCVYNGEMSPPYSPEDKPEYSTMKSQTIKGSGFNEFRFCDLKDKEEIYTFAQKDVNTLITNSRTEEIQKADDTLTLDKGSKHQTLKGDGTTYDITIESGDYNLVIKKGNQNITLKQGNQVTELDQGDMTVTLKQGNWDQQLQQGNGTLKITGDLTIETTGKVTIKADQDITFQSQMNIALKAQANITAEAGANFQVKANAQFQAQAAMVDVKASGMMQLQAQGMAVFKSSGMTMIKGSIVMIG